MTNRKSVLELSKFFCKGGPFSKKIFAKNFTFIFSYLDNSKTLLLLVIFLFSASFSYSLFFLRHPVCSGDGLGVRWWWYDNQNKPEVKLRNTTEDMVLWNSKLRASPIITDQSPVQSTSHLPRFPCSVKILTRLSQF